MQFLIRLLKSGSLKLSGSLRLCSRYIIEAPDFIALNLCCLHALSKTCGPAVHFCILVTKLSTTIFCSPSLNKDMALQDSFSVVQFLAMATKQCFFTFKQV